MEILSYITLFLVIFYNKKMIAYQEDQNGYYDLIPYDFPSFVISPLLISQQEQEGKYQFISYQLAAIPCG